MSKPLKKTMWNPLFWHEHPNPWVRRPFIVLAFLPLFFIFLPLAFGWMMLRARVRDFVHAVVEFFEDAWDDLSENAQTWWRAVRWCPRVWWQPVDRHEAYAKKLQEADNGQ